jgi:hypothetical protein
MELIAYLLSSMGLTVLVIWPTGGPGAFARERLLRKILPRSAHGVLDCYICFSFWSALAVAVPWWFIFHRPCVWFGPLMVPALFWLVMGKWKD